MAVRSLSTAATPVGVGRGGAAVRGGIPLYVSLYQTGMFLLAVCLHTLARGESSGLNLDRAEPFIYSILGLWGVAIAVGCVSPFGSFVRLRVVGDLIFSLALVWWTGGVESYFLPILFANVLASSTFFGLQTALAIGCTSIVVLTAITVSRLAGWYSPVDSMGITQSVVEGREPYIVSCLFGQAIAIQVIAFLGSRLMGRLRRVLGINDLIVKNIGEGLVALDDRNRIILLNQEALRLLGYPDSTEWQGKRPHEIFRRQSDRPIVKALESGHEEVSFQWLGSRTDSSPISVRVRQIVCEADGRSFQVVLIRDQTLERRAVAAEARVRHLEELEDMAHGLAHEIRNPLGSIRGCVQELARGTLDAEQSGRMAKIVLRESDRLDRIVDEFMEYSRSGSTREELVRIDRSIGDVVESLRQRPDAAQISVEFESAAGVEAQVLGDREQVYRVFLNLGVNAIEASSEGGAVRFALQRDGEQWRVTVTDQGHGMSEAVRARVFNPFFTTKTREGGLGLSIVEKVVHGHGGTIDVASSEGEGTTFTVWLPVASQAIEPTIVEAGAVA